MGAVTSSACAAVLLDAEGEPIRPAIMDLAEASAHLVRIDWAVTTRANMVPAMQDAFNVSCGRANGMATWKRSE